METEKIYEKLNSFSEIVLKDAFSKANDILKNAQKEKEEKVEESEISFLKEAYQKIHEAIGEIEKDNNSIYSGKLFDAKKVLYNKRKEITDKIFERVSVKLEKYRKSDEYIQKLKQFIEKGLNEVGIGNIRVIVDERDLGFVRKIAREIKKEIEITESETKLAGGCIIMNKTSGLLADYSFKSRIEQQRKAFLEFSGLNIEI